jgi:hypothetical protein
MTTIYVKCLVCKTPGCIDICTVPGTTVYEVRTPTGWAAIPEKRIPDSFFLLCPDHQDAMK